MAGAQCASRGRHQGHSSLDTTRDSLDMRKSLWLLVLMRGRRNECRVDADVFSEKEPLANTFQ